MTEIETITQMSDSEVDAVSGGFPVLVVWALWTCGGAAIGLGAAAAVHYFGNGDHSHK